MDFPLLKRQLKEWEHDFIRRHSRPPTRRDVDASAPMKAKYKQYSQLKAARARGERQQRTPVKQAPVERLRETPDWQCGPTPQVLGESVGILDLTPVVKRLDIRVDPDSEEEDDKTLGESQVDTPVEAQVEALDSTVTLLRPPSQSRYGPNSPLKIGCALKWKKSPKGQVRASPLKYTPSPLWKRSLTKSLAELENEFQSVRRELNITEEVETEDEQEQEQEHIPEKKKRNRRILRRLDAGQGDEAAVTDQTDLHGMMLKLKNGETIEREPQPVKNEPKRSKKPKKYNLVSDNFRRLKLPTNKSRKNARNWRRKH
ncbi:Sld2p KNAG_0A06440 [Huiozyma naganishii CBS 8797]|uniref:DNA replication regulator SLD2 n=1 Tax=Huiozyma naganishii (strain ATCC MYA-139 / BCRC 22969 / CBS 8797 / KCTC 17520 / NBRC 10181 / NCYC 3082 / Yp74L-3) TaxID=1071383 RepID=J7RU19_HUIN7|nr:hypothetical protein KNAG_0A06440 [Kazachstania naganishii CBS 8797]CCK68302.1 hypothetical protein KNAG_0A06440 [Kazachstania naganishii CBS 8797]